MIAQVDNNSNSGMNKPLMELTLKDAINLALQNNWDIKLSEKEIQKANEQISEAYANAFPRVDVKGNYTRNIKLPVMFLPPNTSFNPTDQVQTFELGASNNWDASVTLSQVIYSQKVNTAIKIADEYAELSRAGNQSVRNDVVLGVKKAFYGVLLMQELVKVSRHGYDVAKANYDNVSAMYKQGVASEYDYLRAEVQLANSTPMLTQMENNFEMSKNLLKNILALDVQTPIKVVGEFVYTELPTSILEEHGINSIDANPLVKQLGIQASLLDKNITIERSEYFPTLAAFGTYAYQTQDNTYNFKDYLWAKSFMVGLSLQYTLFDGFRRGARIEQATIDKEKVELNKRKLEDGLKIRVIQAMNGMDEARKRIKAQEKSLEQAEKALTIAQSRFKNGVGTQLELIDGQAALTISQTNYAQAIYDYLSAKADWENVVAIEN
jgi:outer membrane protein